MSSHVQCYGTIKCDNDGRIDRTLPCTKCGYELRGLEPSALCPECGQGIQTSAYAKKRTRNRARRMVMWTAIAVMAFFVYCFMLNTV